MNERPDAQPWLTLLTRQNNAWLDSVSREAHLMIAQRHAEGVAQLKKLADSHRGEPDKPAAKSSPRNH